MESVIKEKENKNEQAPEFKKTGDKILTGMFKDHVSAERAYNTLKDRGYTEKEINLIMSDETRKKHFADKGGDTKFANKSKEAGGAGAIIGGSVGAAAGIIAAVGASSLFIPGLGLVVAGPLLAGLAGAGIGGVAGGLIGAMVGAGIPEAKAKSYEKGVKEGGIVMAVRPHNEEDAKFFENVWQTNKVEEFYR